MCMIDDLEEIFFMLKYSSKERRVSLVVHISPEDEGTNGSVHLTSLLVFSLVHVVAGLLDVLGDLNTVHDDVVLGINDKLLGVEESLSHCGKLGDILVTDGSAVFHEDSNLTDELSELIDTISNVVEGGILEVLDSSVHGGGKRSEILDASVEVVDLLDLEDGDEDAINDLNDLLGGLNTTGSGISGHKAHSEGRSHIFCFLFL